MMRPWLPAYLNKLDAVTTDPTWMRPQVSSAVSSSHLQKSLADGGDTGRVREGAQAEGSGPA